MSMMYPLPPTFSCLQICWLLWFSLSVICLGCQAPLQANEKITSCCVGWAMGGGGQHASASYSYSGWLGSVDLVTVKTSNLNFIWSVNMPHRYPQWPRYHFVNTCDTSRYPANTTCETTSITDTTSCLTSQDAYCKLCDALLYRSPSSQEYSTL